MDTPKWDACTMDPHRRQNTMPNARSRMVNSAQYCHSIARAGTQNHSEALPNRAVFTSHSQGTQ